MLEQQLRRQGSIWKGCCRSCGWGSCLFLTWTIKRSWALCHLCYKQKKQNQIGLYTCGWEGQTLGRDLSPRCQSWRSHGCLWNKFTKSQFYLFSKSGSILTSAGSDWPSTTLWVFHWNIWLSKFRSKIMCYHVTRRFQLGTKDILLVEVIYARINYWRTCIFSKNE